MHKIKADQLIAGTIKQNYRGTIERFVASDSAFSFYFMSSVLKKQHTGSSFYLYVLAMIKHLETRKFFLTLSSAGLRWENFPYIINKLNNLRIRKEKLKNLSYQERCNFLNNNPFLVAKHFHYKAETFFKEMILGGPFGKTKYFAFCIEYQETDSISGFLMHQIFTMRQPTLIPLKIQ